MFPALGNPSALTVIWRPTSASGKLWITMVIAAAAGPRPPPLEAIWTVGIKRLTGLGAFIKLFLNTGVWEGIHITREGMKTARNLIGSVMTASTKERGAALAADPVLFLRAHTACWMGTGRAPRVRELPRDLILMLVMGPIGVRLASAKAQVAGPLLGN